MTGPTPAHPTAAHPTPGAGEPAATRHTAPAAEAHPVGPLAGVRVIDLSRALAGPYAAALLSDLGATVVKVEARQGGDSSRAWAPFDGEHSLYFDSANRGKQSVAVDFYTPAGQALLRQLVHHADVVIENFRPGVLAAMGLDPAVLRTEQPGLILASVTGFGPDGPLSQTAGLDQVAQAMSGLMSVTGEDEDHRVRVGVPIMDLVAGIYTAFGVCAALAGRGRDGVGAAVATSLLETGLSLSAFQGQQFLSTGVVPVPQGNQHPLLSPYGQFTAADGPFILAVGSEKQWQGLCTLLDAPELAADPHYATSKLRSVHRQALRAALDSRLLQAPVQVWLDRLRAAGIPAGPVYDYAQAFADPQVQHLNMVQAVRRGDGTVLPLLRGPVSFDGRAPVVRKAPPLLGEDTVAVLTGLGLTAAQIAGLVASGVIGVWAADA